MGSNRVHQLSSGLYVSGTPDQYGQRAPTMTSTAVPYTGGDIKRSGELGKMFDISVDHGRHKKSGSLTSPSARAGSFRTASASNSGHLIPPPPPQITHLGSFSNRTNSNSGEANHVKSGKSNSGETNHGKPAPTLKTSGPLSHHSSGPLTPNLPATGLITSGPVSSGASSRNHSGPLDGSKNISNQGNKNPSNQTNKTHGNQAITYIRNEQKPSMIKKLPRVILWTVVPLFIIGFIAGGFILGAVQNAVLLIIVSCFFVIVVMVMIWNSCMAHRAVTGFIAKYPETGLNEAENGQYVKITGIVTCGSVPLETSYQKISRCVYTSCAIYEYRGFKGKKAHAKHRIFTWGLRYMERRGSDFYISDYKSGLRALVKVGHGATVTPYVEDTTIVDVTKKEREISPNFLQWLSEHNLSSDDRVMRLKEGYIKEGSTITVMGVVQRTDNVVMIVPPSEPVSTGCQWTRFFLPTTMSGITLICEDNSKDDVVPV